jgi:hypothetical protein
LGFLSLFTSCAKGLCTTDSIIVVGITTIQEWSGAAALPLLQIVVELPEDNCWLLSQILPFWLSLFIALPYSPRENKTR